VFARVLIQFVTRERSAEKAIVKYFQRKRKDQLQECVLARRHADNQGQHCDMFAREGHIAQSGSWAL
jgi:hypothetical protein